MAADLSVEQPGEALENWNTAGPLWGRLETVGFTRHELEHAVGKGKTTTWMPNGVDLAGCGFPKTWRQARELDADVPMFGPMYELVLALMAVDVNSGESPCMFDWDGDEVVCWRRALMGEH